MQHDEKKCKKCGGFVVGNDAIDAMVNGICAHCANKGTRRKPLSEEVKRGIASARAAKLAARAMKHQQKKNKIRK